MEALGLDRIKDYEIYYWEKVTLQYMNFRDHSIGVKASVTYLTLSPFKEYILTGMNNGEVYMYDALSSPSGIIVIHNLKSPMLSLAQNPILQLLIFNSQWTTSDT